MTPSNIATAYTVTDGEDIVKARTWDTREAAEEAMRDMCFHPKRHAGPFRVEPVQVEVSRWGTVLAVTRIP